MPHLIGSRRGEIGKRSPHVLVVDHEAAVCDVVRMALEADGAWRVTGALSAVDVLATLHEDRPHGVIIDAAMPPTSGLAVAVTALTLGIPVLLMTGTREVQQILSANGIPFLAKPIRIREVVTETRLLVREAKERHAQLTMQMARLIAAGDGAGELSNERVKTSAAC